MTRQIVGGSPAEVVEVIDFTLDAIQAENPDFILVGDDLLNSRWHLAKSEEYRFGSLNNRGEKGASIRDAAEVYYTRWLAMFSSRNLAIFPAVGDHELGDNNRPAVCNKSFLVESYRDNFALILLGEGSTAATIADILFDGRVAVLPLGTPWEDTACAFVAGNTLFTTIDVFSQDDPMATLHPKTGTVLATIEAGQLEWLRDLCTAALESREIGATIVQGHTPVLTPFRVRTSSELHLVDRDADSGEQTAFWQLLEELDVALYLSGEVHNISHSTSGGYEAREATGLLECFGTC